MKRAFFLCMVLALICWSGMAVSSDFPTKDLQGVIMWGAGGATDNVARAITPIAESHLGKSIVLINKAGGTGAISTQYVNSRPSDGYTILYGAENPQLHGVLELSKLDYKDFYPVNVLAYGVGVIVVNNNMPWNSFKELVEDAKKRPGQIKMGSTGPGGLPYTVGAMIQSVTVFDVIKVPFDGEGPGVTNLMGGHVDVIPVGLTAVREHIRAGRVKALAIVAKEPVEGLEEIPLITQDFPEYSKYLPWGPFYGVWCNRDVPADVRKILVNAFHKAASDEKFKKFIQDFGAITLNIHGDEADAFLKKWQSTSTWLLQDAGATKVSPEKLGIPKP